MKYRLTAATALLALSTFAAAHTHLKMSMPAENAVLTAPPSQIMLHFSVPTRLTAVTIQKEGESQLRNLGPLPKEPSAELSVPVTSLTPGKYTVSWRAVGGDNHVMSGALHFTIGT